MTNRLRITVLVLCIMGLAAFRVEAQQPPTRSGAGGNGEAQQLRQEIQALRQQAAPLRAHIQQLLGQVRAAREQLRPIEEKIRLDREKLGHLHREYKEHHQQPQQSNSGQPSSQQPVPISNHAQ